MKYGAAYQNSLEQKVLKCNKESRVAVEKCDRQVLAEVKKWRILMSERKGRDIDAQSRVRFMGHLIEDQRERVHMLTMKL